MHAARTTILSLFALAPGAAAQNLDLQLLDKIAKEVLPVVVEMTGAKLEGVKIQLADTAELTKLMTREFQATNQITGRTKASARVLARSVAKMLLGKYDWTARRVVLCPGNFTAQAKVLKAPGMNTVGLYRAVLVHELIHAADDELYGWSKKFLAAKDAKALETFNALIEGNAQRLTAKICAKQGWQKGFDLFTKNIGSVAPNTPPAEKMLLSVQLANVRAAYVEGRKFVEYITEQTGPGAIGTLFGKPPSDFEVILHPAWYLKPDLRPSRLYNLDAPLATLGKKLSKDWKTQITTIATPQLKNALALLKKEEIEAVLSSLRFNRILLCKEKAAPTRGMIVACLYEFVSPAAARHFVVASDHLSHAKDEALKTGRVRILSAKYLGLDEGGAHGIIFDKMVQAGRQKVRATTLVAAKGSICVELMHSNNDIAIPELKRRALKLLSDTSTIAAKKPASQPSPQPKKSK